MIAYGISLVVVTVISVLVLLRYRKCIHNKIQISLKQRLSAIQVERITSDGKPNDIKISIRPVMGRRGRRMCL